MRKYPSFLQKTTYVKRKVSLTINPKQVLATKEVFPNTILASSSSYGTFKREACENITFAFGSLLVALSMVSMHGPSGLAYISC